MLWITLFGPGNPVQNPPHSPGVNSPWLDLVGGKASPPRANVSQSLARCYLLLTLGMLSSLQTAHSPFWCHFSTPCVMIFICVILPSQTPSLLALMHSDEPAIRGRLWLPSCSHLALPSWHVKCLLSVHGSSSKHVTALGEPTLSWRQRWWCLLAFAGNSVFWMLQAL